MILTLRSGEPNLDPVLALWKDGLAEYLELRPRPSRRSRGRLAPAWAATSRARRYEGFGKSRAGTRRSFGSSSCRGSSGARSGGIWRWTGSIEPGARLGEIVASRLGRLTDDQLDALELVTLGEPIGLTLLERLAAPGPARVRRAGA